MSELETQTCPTCDGRGKTTALVNRRDGQGGLESLPCGTCGGRGWLSQAELDEIERRTALRQARRGPRLALDLSLREMAAKHGVLPSVYADWEAGRLLELPGQPKEGTDVHGV